MMDKEKQKQLIIDRLSEIRNGVAKCQPRASDGEFSEEFKMRMFMLCHEIADEQKFGGIIPRFKNISDDKKAKR